MMGFAFTPFGREREKEREEGRERQAQEHRCPSPVVCILFMSDILQMKTFKLHWLRKKGELTQDVPPHTRTAHPGYVAWLSDWLLVFGSSFTKSRAVDRRCAGQRIKLHQYNSTPECHFIQHASTAEPGGAWQQCERGSRCLDMHIYLKTYIFKT